MTGPATGFILGAAAVLAGSAASADVPRESPPQSAPEPGPIPIPQGPLARKLPAGVQCIEVKMPKSAWSAWRMSAVGDWVEYESEPAPGFKSKTRMEVFDLGGNGLIVMNTNSTTVAGMDNKFQNALRYVFSEPDPPSPGMNDDAPKVTVRDDPVTAAGRRFSAKLHEAAVGAKSSKTWVSEEVPCGGMVKCEFDGKVLMQVTGFGRGK